MQDTHNITKVLMELQQESQKEIRDLHDKEAKHKEIESKIMVLKQKVHIAEKTLEDDKKELKELEKEAPKLELEIKDLKRDQLKTHVELTQIQQQHANALRESNIKGIKSL